MIYMRDLIQSRLPDDDSKEWMLDYMHSLGFVEYMDYERKVFNALDILKPGKHYNIEKDVPLDKQDLFIKLGCLYIQQHPEVMFSDDYSKILKIKDYEQWKLEAGRKTVRDTECRKNDSV